MTVLLRLVELEETLGKQGCMPWEGYAEATIGHILLLTRAGKLHSIVTTDPMAAERMVPRRVKRASGKRANLLWDTPAYALGLGGKSVADAAASHALFVAKMAGLPAAVREDEGIQAVQAFLARYDPAAFACTEEGRMLIKSGRNVTFALEGRDELVVECPALRAFLGGDLPATKEITCQITGRPDRLAMLHPALKDIPRGNPMGTTLVIFNKASVRFHGREQGENAEIGHRTAISYVNALQWLLNNRGHRIVVGDHVIVAWVDGLPAGADDILPNIWGASLDSKVDDETAVAPPPPMPDADPVKAVISAPRKGLEPMAPAAKFHLLGLTGVQARVAVSMWHEEAVADILANVQAWHDGMTLAGRREGAFGTGRGIRDILFALTPEAKGKIDFKRLSGRDATRLWLAALRRLLVPEQMVSAALTRLRVGCSGDRRHTLTAFLKLYLERNHGMTLGPILDAAQEEIGYLLGCELAIAEYAQRIATSGPKGSGDTAPNVTLVDRFWSLASTRPQRAYPTIYKLYNTYLHRLRRTRPESVVWIASMMDKVRMRHAGAPATLSREQQCLFACGYSQQTTELWAKRDVGAKSTEQTVPKPAAA